MSQTKAQLIDPVDGTIVNADINASAAIAGTKVSPNFGSQNILTTGKLGVGTTSLNNVFPITVQAEFPGIQFLDAQGTDSFGINADGGVLKLQVGVAGSGPTQILQIASASTTVTNNLNANSGLDVAGNITGTQDLTLSSGGANRLQMTSPGGGVFLIKNPSAAALAFGANNAEKMRIDSSGLVRIHNTNMSANGAAQSLIVGTSGTAGDAYGISIFAGSSASSNIFFGDSDGAQGDRRGTIRYFHTTDQFQLNTAGNNLGLCVDASQRVGIGTSSPTEELSITSNSTGSQMQFRDSGTGTSGNDGFRVGYNGSGGQLWNFENNYVRFATNNVERMRILNDGKVGIGISNPDQLVHISKSSGTTLFKASVAGNSTIGLEIQKTGSTTQSWRIVDGQTVNGKLEFYDVTDSATRMCIDGDGKVGIGTTSPDSKLHISGTASNLNSRIRITDTQNNHTFAVGADGNGSFQSTINDTKHLIYTNGVLRGRWTEHGLMFGSDTASANALDDYEEGTFVPVLKGVDGGGTLTGSTAAGAGGNYTKIGNKVHFSFYFANPSGTNPSGTLYFEMPFSAASGNSYQGAGGCVTYTRNINPGSGRMFAVNAIAGTNRLYLTRVSVGGEGETVYQNISDDNNLASMLFKVTVTFVAA